MDLWLTIANPNDYLVDLKIQRGSSSKQQLQIQELPAFGARYSCSVDPNSAGKYTLGDLAPDAEPSDKGSD